MGRRFTELAYSKSVKEAQVKYRSREMNEKMEQSVIANDQFSDSEAQFIENMDTFFMSSVGENGWPYVQHRGGKKGFVKVVNNKCLAFPDFRGNRQFISVGNINENKKVCLFFLDFVNKRRLKVWAKARVIEIHENDELFNKLKLSDYRAKIERLIVFDIEAFDWNCPQHITQRYTASEIEERENALLHHIDKLESELESLKEKLMK